MFGFGKDKQIAKEYEAIYFTAYDITKFEIEQGDFPKQDFAARLDRHMCELLSMRPQ